MKLPFSILFVLTLVTHAETVHGLIDQALTSNPELHYYEAEIAAAKAGKETAGQFANPNLALEMGGEHITGASGNTVLWRAEISQTFDLPGRITLRKALAERDIAIAELGLIQFKSLLANSVQQRAGDVQLLRRKVEATHAVRQRLEELIAVLVQRDTGNVSAKLERRILEATLLTSDRALTDATKESQEAEIALNMLCNRAPDTAIQLSESDISFPSAPSLAKLKTQAALANYEVQQKRVQLARQGIKIDLTKSERWGDITFGPYVANDRAMEVGLAMSVPLPLWNRGKGAIAGEQARQQQAEALIASTLRDLERDLSIQRAGYTAELEALTRWKPETEKEFQEAAAEADRHYRLGAVPATTYVEMQRGYLEALDALIETRRNAWKHRMELERLTGKSLEAMK
jgi:outer membrane protein, heavy metal efflux system